MPRRRTGLFVAVAFGLLGGAYLASPWVVTNRMRRAAEAGDGERLARYVDYPALRQSLAEEIQAGILGRRAGEPGQQPERRGPFAAFGEALAGTMVSAFVESMVTPESVAAMVERGRVERGDASSRSARDPGSRKPVERRRHYESLDVFDVDMHDPETKELLVTLVFHRERPFGWKLAGVRLPR